MEHAPIYRSTRRLTRSSAIPWRRTASLVSAAAGIALGGIALGYHGFAIANDTLQVAESASRGASLPLPGFSVLSRDGGHPDAISALSSALLAQIPASPGLLRPAGPLPLPFPVRAQPTAEPVAPFSDIDLPFVRPQQLSFDVVANPTPLTTDDAAVLDQSADDAAVQLESVAQVQSGSPVVSLAPVGVAAPSHAAEPEEVAASEPPVADAPQMDSAPAPETAAAVSASASPAATAAPVVHPARSSPKVAPAATAAPKPVVVAEPPVDREPALVVREIITLEERKPVEVRRPVPAVEIRVDPPRQDQPRGNASKPNDNNNKPNDNNNKGSNGGQGNKPADKGKGGGQHGGG